MRGTVHINNGLIVLLFDSVTLLNPSHVDVSFNTPQQRHNIPDRCPDALNGLY